MGLANNLETMLARGQDNALVRYGLGNEYLKRKEFDKAAVHLRRPRRSRLMRPVSGSPTRKAMCRQPTRCVCS
jgi:hypothetical protein